jgi:hypothetical protein
MTTGYRMGRRFRKTWFGGVLGTAALAMAREQVMGAIEILLAMGLLAHCL